MKVPGPLSEARFLRRDGRFKGAVEHEGRVKAVHIHDPGRLAELLKPGVKVLVRPHGREGLKTELYLVAVLDGGCWVLVDSALHARLAEEALRLGAVEELKGYRVVRREVRVVGGRIDLMLEGPSGKPALLEVKGCTLVRGGVALFPDAPTARGVRHLRVLARALREGYESFLMFLVTHCGAEELRPNFEVDAGFSQALREAVEEGVKAMAYKAALRGDVVEVTSPLPVRLEPPCRRGRS